MIMTDPDEVVDGACNLFCVCVCVLGLVLERSRLRLWGLGCFSKVVVVDEYAPCIVAFQLLARVGVLEAIRHESVTGDFQGGVARE